MNVFKTHSTSHGLVIDKTTEILEIISIIIMKIFYIKIFYIKSLTLMNKVR